MKKKADIDDCSLMYLDQYGNRNGHITSIEIESNFPFNFERIFYLFDIPSGESRGAHSHLECHQFLVAVSGSFSVYVDDGRSTNEFVLNRPNIGLHIPPGIWASEGNFSSGAVCLVFASHKYDENDYIREYSQFIRT